jgi:hypothetical protein
MRTNLLLRPLTFILLFIAVTAQAQYKISGTVVSDKNKPIKGASVFLENTIDGGTTDSNGIFQFTTDEKGNQSIVAQEVGHATAGLPILINGDMSGIVLVLKKNASRDLEEVVITAGAIDASNDKSKTVLQPLDIVTTAGSGADPVKAMQMLPGVQQTGPDNGLFVRGGDANEAAIIVDETIVQNAFISGPPGVTTRSRFGPFQYKGVSFSSGGYSARYGQALSGVLELTSNDLAEKSTINLGANTAGIYASGVKKWKNSSLEGGGGYTNLTPFYGIAKTNFDFYKVPVGGNANVRYVWQPNKDGILKLSANTSFFESGIKMPNPYFYSPVAADSSTAFMREMGDTINFVTRNNYYFASASYKQMFKTKYSLYTAASVSLDRNNNTFGEASVFPMDIKQDEYRGQFRLEGKRYFTSRLNLLVGTDFQHFGINKDNVFTKTKPAFTFHQEFKEDLIGAYTELEWTPINRLALRPGIRYEHSALLDTDVVAPRLSMAYKTGVHSQVSVATGMFFQEASYSYLLAGFRPGMQLATHYIANYQWSADSRTLRIEGYRKVYDKLVLEAPLPGTPFNPNTYRIVSPATVGLTNDGYGYAQGLELFWRDKKTVKNFDYWLSYSFIDTKRKYGNFIAEATPSFIANHNASFVGKYFVEKIQTSISATYTFATGRPYYNPASPVFMADKTPAYHNLALQAAYLRSFGKWFTVFYISVDNVLNRHNVFGYYGGDVNKPIVPALYRTVFFGVNMSLTQFKKDEL